MQVMECVMFLGQFYDMSFTPNVMPGINKTRNKAIVGLEGETQTSEPRAQCSDFGHSICSMATLEVACKQGGLT